jgi:AcrR family transcriptional regulator
LRKRAITHAAKETRRSFILDAALEEFFEHGYSGTRMDDVAQRAGVSKGTVYLYFDSKKELFQALISSLISPKLAEIEAIAINTPCIFTALQQIALFGPIMIRESKLPRLMKVIIGDSHLFPDIVTRYRETVVERILGIVSRMLEAAAARGEISIEDPSLTARLVIAPIVMSSVWQTVFGRDTEAHVDLEALFQIHCRLMTKALKPDGEVL